MGLFSAKKQEEFIGVIAISSGAVSGAVFLKTQNDLPVVVADSLKRLPVVEKGSEHRIEKNILKKLDEVLVCLLEEVKVKPSKIYCILSAPFAFAEIRTIKIGKDKEFVFTRKIEDSVITNEVKIFRDSGEENSVLIDKKVTNVLLNGYSVDNPYGIKAKNVELEVFLSASYKNFINALEDKIHKTFKSRIFFSSNMLASFVFARDVFSLSKESIILDISEENTEIVFSKSGYMASTASIPFGMNYLIRVISEDLMVSYPQAESMLNLYNDGLLSHENEKEIKSTIEHLMERWMGSMKRVFTEILPSRNIPHRIFIKTNEKSPFLFLEKIFEKGFSQFTTGHDKFNVIILTAKDLHDFYDRTPKIKPNSNILSKIIYINQL
jgi:cell division ATPase FtsA